MTKYRIPLLLTFLLALSCQSQQPDFGEPGKHESYIRIVKTGCFGKCPAYTITLFKNGVLTYEGRRYVDKIGKFYTILKGEELRGWEERIKKANLLQMADKYPEHFVVPQDIPAIIITYSEKGKTKTITDYGHNDPRALHNLIPALDSLVASKNLHVFDK